MHRSNTFRVSMDRQIYVLGYLEWKANGSIGCRAEPGDSYAWTSCLQFVQLPAIEETLTFKQEEMQL